MNYDRSAQARAVAGRASEALSELDLLMTQFAQDFLPDCRADAGIRRRSIAYGTDRGFAAGQ